MLVFIDESGDSGLKVEAGSSRFFTVALVVFEDYEEANACDKRIELLAKEIGWVAGSEGGTAAGWSWPPGAVDCGAPRPRSAISR